MNPKLSAALSGRVVVAALTLMTVAAPVISSCGKRVSANSPAAVAAVEAPPEVEVPDTTTWKVRSATTEIGIDGKDYEPQSKPLLPFIEGVGFELAFLSKYPDLELVAVFEDGTVTRYNAGPDERGFPKSKCVDRLRCTWSKVHVPRDQYVTFIVVDLDIEKEVAARIAPQLLFSLVQRWLGHDFVGAMTFQTSSGPYDEERALKVERLAREWMNNRVNNIPPESDTFPVVKRRDCREEECAPDPETGTAAFLVIPM